jgi:uncharacterized protein
MSNEPIAVKKIAVVGGGIAGLGAAWSLSRRHEVTLYESHSQLGGHANTVDVNDNGRTVAVDTGFIVYNVRNYPNLIALFDTLGVATAESDMSFGVSLDSGRVEYAGSGLAGVFAQRRNAVSPRFWRMLVDIKRFYAAASGYLESMAPGLSVHELLQHEGYSDAFIDDHLIPMAAAIWSASRQAIAQYPADAFIRFFDNHGLLDLGRRPNWRTVRGGSREYVSRLVDDTVMTVHAGTPVNSITRDARGVTVVDGSGHSQRYDEIVIATHADQALALLGDATASERSVLGAFEYSQNTAFLHEDRRLMPRRRAAWSSWNYLQSEHSGDENPLCVTYWMNRLQPLQTDRQLFVTLNPTRNPPTILTQGYYAYEHPIFTSATSYQQEQSIAIQGRQRTWFCGSYFGHGFHEDALQSGLWVADQLGCSRPWASTAGYGRLPTSYDAPNSRPRAALSA